jgi:WhiB family redox-sensing transcriptional regulator
MTVKANWRDRALCYGADPEIFFPPTIGGKKVAAEALKICRSCPVRIECLKYALRHKAHGVWGGTTQRQRALMLPMIEQRRNERETQHV